MPVLAMATALWGCEVRSVVPDGPNEVIHPRDEARLSSQANAPTTDVSAASSPQGMSPLVSRLSSFDGPTTRGLADSRDGPAGFVFGTLVDAAADESGALLLLDGDYVLVRSLSASLDSVQIIGRAGEGPGEFVQPISLLSVAADRFAVFDRANHRLQSFEGSGGTFVPSGQSTVQKLAELRDACSLNGSYFIKGMQMMIAGDAAESNELRGVDLTEVTPGGYSIHKINGEGEVVRSFSRPYLEGLPNNGPHNIDLAAHVNEGPIECGNDRIFAAYTLLGEVHALSSDGDLAWIVRFTDYDFPGYIYRWLDSGGPLPGSGSLDVDAEAGNYAIDTISHITLLSPDILAVSIDRRIVGSRLDDYPVSHSYRTYLINPMDGSSLGAFVAEHEVIGGGNGTAVLYRPEPFPEIGVVSVK